MITRYGLLTGLSDHTLDNSTAIASIALGASIIEKHFTLDRLGGGPDDSFSLEPNDLKELCANSRTAWEALGGIDYGRNSSELGSVKFRRSLYFVQDVSVGQIINSGDIRSIRPGFGLPAKYAERIVGSIARVDVARGTPVSWDCIEAHDKDLK